LVERIRQFYCSNESELKTMRAVNVSTNRVRAGTPNSISGESLSIGNVKILCGSWNMGNAEPEGLDSLVPPGGGDYDIIVLGLQESTYTRGANTSGKSPVAASHSSDMLSSSKQKNIDAVLENIEEAFLPSIAHLGGELRNLLGPDFDLLEHSNRYQMQLYIFVRKHLKPHISNVEKSVENTGFLSIMPNKGGLCTTFTIFSTKLAFISAHLAAHEVSDMTRNQEGQSDLVLNTKPSTSIHLLTNEYRPLSILDP
jgi:hypothetical protein